MVITADSATNTSPREWKGKSLWLGLLLSRLLLLGLGGSLAWCLGIGIALFYPNPNPEMPWVMKLLEPTNPQTPSTPSSSSPTNTSPSSQLTPEQRQQLQIELQQLQAQIKAVGDRTTFLETQFGSSRPNEPLETRLQSLIEQLQTAPLPEQNTSVPAATNSNQSASPAQTQSDTLKLTLPSDILFQDSSLLPEADSILDKIITDLRNYEGATISIAVHTDDTGDAQDNRELSFRRAVALEKYLANAVGSKKYHWIAVGYGETHPLVINNSDEQRQRNRRVEIAINRD